MRCEFHRLVLLPRDIGVWINPSFQDSFMLLLEINITAKYELDVNVGVCSDTYIFSPWETQSNNYGNSV